MTVAAPTACSPPASTWWATACRRAASTMRRPTWASGSCATGSCCRSRLRSRAGRIRSMMHAYDDLDGVPCVASRWLLTDVLRDEWGFDGLVVSDYMGIELLERSHRDGARPARRPRAWRSRRAWTTTCRPRSPTASRCARRSRPARSTSRWWTPRSAGRSLEKLALGLFEDPYVDEDGPELTGARRTEDLALAREAARRSLVLLRNEGAVLPAGRAPDDRGARTQRRLGAQPPGRLRPRGPRREPARDAAARATSRWSRTPAA